MRDGLQVDKSKVRHAFAQAAERYDSLTSLQRQVGLALLRRFPLAQSGGLLVDLGCGTGFLTQEIATRNPCHSIIALDIALPMLQTCRRNHPRLPAQYLCADAEQLPLATASIDSLYSNLALQWALDLPATLAEFARVLNTEGQLVFAIFGPATLQELKAAWAVVDDYVHVNHFHAACDLENFLQEAGFTAINIECKRYESHYPSVQALMQELKGIGAHNVNRGRNPRPTTKSRLQRMIEAYQHLMQGQPIMATYEILFVQAFVAKTA